MNKQLAAEKTIIAYADWELEDIMKYLLKGQGWNGFDSSAVAGAIAGRVKIKITLEVERL